MVAESLSPRFAFCFCPCRIAWLLFSKGGAVTEKIAEKHEKVGGIEIHMLLSQRLAPFCHLSQGHDYSESQTLHRAPRSKAQEQVDPCLPLYKCENWSAGPNWGSAVLRPP